MEELSRFFLRLIILKTTRTMERQMEVQSNTDPLCFVGISCFSRLHMNYYLHILETMTFSFDDSEFQV